jgi:serine protease
MQRQKTSSAVRWLAYAALGIAAVPMGLAWRAEQARNASQEPIPPAMSAAELAEWVRPNEIAVQLKKGTDSSVLGMVSSKVGLPLVWNSSLGAQSGIARISVPFGQSADTILAKLASDPNIEAADVVHIYRTPVIEDSEPASDAGTAADDSGKWKPNDPRYGEQWNFRMINAEGAWEHTRGKGVVVAVIDTGVAYADTKKGKIARDFKNTKFVKGYDFVNKDDLPNDDQGHGTHVAGTIAESTDNNEGVAGLAFETTIMPLKVLSASGSGTSTDIAEAIRWAADNGANIINMSLGSSFPDKLMRSACEYAKKKGVTIVCAAGNSGKEGVGYPAAYKDCIAVSSVGPNGELSFYSSWGKEVAIAAPGGDKKQDPNNGGILQNTVFPGSDGRLVDDYYQFQGTSMASPHAAAVAALVASKGVKDPDDVKAVLQKSAKPKEPSNKYGAGVIDAEAAVKLAGKIHGDGVARFWLVAGLFAGCYGIGQLRRKSGRPAVYPFWSTAALSFGLLFPDWLTGYLGMTSHFNIIGHSILIPGALLVLGAKGATERRLLGWMAAGLTLHLGWEFLRGTSPFGVEFGFWQMLPWTLSNSLIGASMLLSGLTAKRE